MTTWLDILDHAVLVGLGALIGGVGTHFITIHRFRHEKHTALQEQKKDLFKEAVSHFNAAGSMSSQYVAVVFDIKLRNDENSLSQFWEAVHLINEAFEHSENAKSFWYMLGQRGLADLTDRYSKSISDLRLHFQSHKLAYESSAFDTIADQIDRISQHVYDQLSEVLDSIYAPVKREGLRWCPWRKKET